MWPRSFTVPGPAEARPTCSGGTMALNRKHLTPVLVGNLEPVTPQPHALIRGVLSVTATEMTPSSAGSLRGGPGLWLVSTMAGPWACPCTHPVGAC